MDRIALRNWPKGVGALLALLLLLSLLSFHLQDPTLTNLRLPGGGIGNWLGLPGALLGGSLLELLGSAALAAPLLLFNWAWMARERPPLHRYAAWSALLLLALAGLQGLAQPPGDPGLLSAGLAGGALREWAGLTTGRWPAAALLAYLGTLAAVRVSYAPLLHAVLRDGRVFGAWLLRAGWRRSTAGWLALRRRAERLQRVAEATAHGLTRQTRLGARELARRALRAPHSGLAWLVESLLGGRSSSLARIKSRSAGFAGPAPAGAGHGDGAEAAADGFDHWLHDEAAPELPAPLAGVLAGSAPARARPAWARDLSWAAASEAMGETPARSASAAPAAAATRAASAGAAAAAPAAAAAGESGAADGAEAAADPAQAEPGRPTGAAALGANDYEFERPEAEAAWRERFQRYARNLDLDWEEQLWKRKDDDPFAEPEEDPAGPKP